jgi:hypothetical protein
MKKICCKSLAFFGLNTLFAFPLFAQSNSINLAHPIPNEIKTTSGVDWNKRVIVATGIGVPNPNMPAAAARPMAIQAARAVAFRNALQLIKGIHVSSTQTVDELMQDDSQIKTSISGYIQSYKESEPKYFSDKTIEITITVPLDNQLQETLLPKEIDNTPEYKKSDVTTNNGTTGIVIDARGLSMVPALTSKIWDEKRNVIYGNQFVKRDAAIKWGMAGYVRSIEQLKKLNERIGSQYLIVKATKLQDKGSTEAVISQADAEKILQSSVQNSLISEAKIVFLID